MPELHTNEPFPLSLLRLQHNPSHRHRAEHTKKLGILAQEFRKNDIIDIIRDYYCIY